MGFDENNYSPIPPLSGVTSQHRNSRPTSTPKPTEEIHLNISYPTHNRGEVNRVNSFNTAQEQVEAEAKQSKRRPAKSSDTRGHSQPGTSDQVESCRPQINCTACRGYDHLRKDCHEDVFCNRCRTRSHATEMCRVPVQPATGNTIFIYCGSVNHTSGRCRNKPNNNREEPRSTPRDFRDQRPKINHTRMGQPQVSHHQTRFYEGLNRQYSPNYANPYQSTLGSIPGHDLSATLMELSNIQSRSLEMMAASQRNQQEAFQELTRAIRDKVNDSMFTSIKIFDGTNRQAFEDWTDKVDQACRASNRGFRTKLFKKSAEAVRQVILSCEEFTDDELVTKLRSCFSHASTMNEAREELQNMRQMEHESISVYMYRWGRALYQSSGIRPNEERHPHVIKDFISSLKKTIRNKIANRWAEMWHPPSTVESVFELASKVEKQLQVTDSFKLEFPSYPSSELNEISTEETSGDEQELNEMSRGKKWGSHTNNYNHKHSSFSNSHDNSYKHQQN